MLILLGPNVSQPSSIIVESSIHTRDINVFGFACRDFEIERFEWTDLRDEAKQECKHLRTPTRLAVSFPPLALIACQRKVISKFARIKVWRLCYQLFLSRHQGHPSHFRNDVADC